MRMFLSNTFKRYSCLINVNSIYKYILPCLYFASVCWCVLPFLQPVWLFGLYRVLTSPRKKGKTTYQSAKARTDTLIHREQKIMFTITRNLHLWHWIENVRALALNSLLTLTLNIKYAMWVIATGNHHHSDYNHFGLSPRCFKVVCSPSACLVLRKSVQNGKLFSFFTIMSS